MLGGDRSSSLLFFLFFFFLGPDDDESSTEKEEEEGSEVLTEPSFLVLGVESFEDESVSLLVLSSDDKIGSESMVRVL